ncbi:MAG TPA: hypothetical protein VGO66_04715 [Solirubrobacterales bacterium]|nr:hypothetical protein [Solirubrobacterales bacterium]
MEAMREKWTDERLDDLKDHMSEGFARIDADLREIRSEIGGLRADVSTEFASVRSEIGGVRSEIGGVRSDIKTEVGGVRTEVNDLRSEMNTRFEATQRLILQVGGGMFGTMLIGFASLLVTQH